MTETLILTIDPPLPCSVLNGSGTCDRPAHTAYAYPTRGPRPGVWLIMPVCIRCVGASTTDATGSQAGRRLDATG